VKKIFNVKRTPSREKYQDTRGHEFDTRPITKSSVIFYTLFLFTFCFVFLVYMVYGDVSKIFTHKMAAWEICLQNGGTEKQTQRKQKQSRIYLTFAFSECHVRTRSAFDNAQRHVTAFRPISEAARSWSCDNIPFPTPFHASAKRKCGFVP